MKVSVVADSTCAPSAAQVKSLGIEIVPINIFLKGKNYRDMIDLEPEKLYRLLPALKELPSTAAPAAGRFQEVFFRLLSQGRRVICFTVTSSLSATYTCALQAVENLCAGGGNEIEIVDTQNAGAASSLLVVEAARLAAKGAAKDDILDQIKAMIPNCKLMGALDSLEYLEKSGRVGKLPALAGDFFRIKPVFCLHRGKAEAYARPRGKRQAVSKMLEAFYRDVEGARKIWVAVTHADAAGECSAMIREIQARLPGLAIDTVPFTVAMGSHTGPGVVGIGYTYL